jgi:site-specific recombinase XerD
VNALRRACASHMLARGANPVQLQMLLGHASLKHLSAYLRLGFRDLQAIHARSRLGA